MTTFNKASLKALYETGDVPTQQNYADWIDSYINIVETTVQSMAGPLVTTELITPRVSATGTVNFGATTFNINSVAFANIVAGSNMLLGAGGGITVSAGTSVTVSAGTSFNVYSDSGIFLRHSDSASVLAVATNVTLDTSNNISASAAGTLSLAAAGGITLASNTAISSGAFISQAPAIVSAAGTAQATAAVLTKLVNRGKGVVDGTTTGFTPLANRAGIVQYLFNEGASANLWPPSGGTINGLAANAPFSLAASAMFTIVHLTASAYAVK